MGKIRSVRRDIKATHDKDGYLIVSFRRGKHKITKKVHRLTAIAFIPNPDKKPQVNHKNGIKDDNRVENLEWNTPTQNEKHSYYVLNRQVPRGENHWRSKLTESNVLEIIQLLLENKLTDAEIAEKFGVSRKTIHGIKSGKNWRHLVDCVFKKNLHTNSRLAEETVLEIYHLCWNTNLTYADIAKKYNVSTSVVNSIKHGYTWNSITGHHVETKTKIPYYSCKITETEALEIYHLVWFTDMTLKEIGKKYNLSVGGVTGIKYGHTWSEITGHVKGTKPNLINKQITELTPDMIDYWL